MRVLRKQIRSWRGIYQTPRSTERLLLYLPTAPQTGHAVRHTHPGDRRPHVHLVSQSAPEPHEHYRDAHAEDAHHGTPGHWHFSIAAEHIHAGLSLLAVAMCVFWQTIADLLSEFDGWSLDFAARGPPL